MKKKVLLTAIVFCLVLASVFATQQLYNQTSKEVKTLDSLFREVGMTMPGLIYPASGDMLIRIIEKTNLEAKLSEDGLKELEILIREFKGENLGLKISDDFSASLKVALTPEIFFNSKPEDRDVEIIGPDTTRLVVTGQRRDWVVPYNEIKPAVSAKADLKMTSYVFGHFEYELSAILSSYHKRNLELNIPYMWYADEKRLVEENQTWPWNTYLAGGTGLFGIAVGRMRVSSGSGVTGNLSIGDNFMYRETFKLSVNPYPFTYELLINTFSHEGSFVKGNNEIVSTKFQNLNLTPELNEDRPLVVIHKATFNLLDKINIGLYEAILDYTTASPFDPQILNPFSLMHNWISFRYNTNNWFGFDVDYAFLPGWSLNLQGMFDQIQQSDEQSKGSPNIYGFLLNVKNSTRINKYKLNTYAELAYTSPGMYLKQDGEKDYQDNPEHWEVDLITGNYQMWCSGEDVSYLGYKFGPNTIAVAVGGELVSENNTVRLDILYKANGDKGLFVDDVAPYGKETHGLLSPHCYTEGNVPQHMVRIAVSDTAVLFDGVLEISGGIAFQHYFNYKFQSGVGSSDVQAQIAFKFSPLSFFSWGK